MGVLLKEIAVQLLECNKKVQLIYAFNGTGKTRLSREFKTKLSDYDNDEDLEDNLFFNKEILYYNAFTEDLFFWDNDLKFDLEPRLKIHPNSFTKWIFEEQGQEQNVINNFQHYADEKLTPHFNDGYTTKNEFGQQVVVEPFTEIKFTFERGNEEESNFIKISKGEESIFIWSVFYSLLELIIDNLNITDPIERDTTKFDKLKYIFIDDPVSSLDDNHLIELAVNLAQLIKKAPSSLKFIITTHNPLFYNVLYNEFSKGKAYVLNKYEDGKFELQDQGNDSPFSYHLFLKKEIEKAIEENRLRKYHFSHLRNILEKTSTFLGYDKWGDLLPNNSNGNSNPYETRIINILNHASHSGEEITELTEDNKRVLKYLVKNIHEIYKFK